MEVSSIRTLKHRLRVCDVGGIGNWSSRSIDVLCDTRCRGVSVYRFPNGKRYTPMLHMNEHTVLVAYAQATANVGLAWISP